MKLLWLTVSGEYAQQLSGDLIAAGYSATEIASTGDFLHYGNTILLLCIEAEKVGALTAFIRSRMNAYRHLEDDPDKSSPASDFALYSIPLSDYQKVGGYHANEKNAMPTVWTLQDACDLFGITMVELFAETDTAAKSLSPNEIRLLEMFRRLSPALQEGVLSVVKNIADLPARKS